MAEATELREPTAKQKLWLFHYTNESNKHTFLNGVQSALRAYDTTDYETANQISVDVKKALAPQLSKWLDEEGLTEDYLKSKVRELCQAQETKFVKIKGKVADSDEHDIVAVSDEETVIAVTVAAHGVQQQATKLGAQVRGMLRDDDDGRKEVHINIINYDKAKRVDVSSDAMFE